MQDTLNDIIVIKNFKIFLEYIKDNNVVLNKEHKLSKKDLFNIWNLLEFKQPYITSTSHSVYYFQINMYYQIAINIDAIKNVKNKLVINENVFNTYITLNEIDKYLTLLNALFVYVDFRDIFDEKVYNVDGNYILVKIIDSILSNIKNGDIDENELNINFLKCYAPYILYEFGVIDVSIDDKNSNLQNYIFKKYLPTQFGREIADIITTKRKVEVWNIPLYLKLNNEDRYTKDISKYIVPFEKLFNKKEFNIIYKLIVKVKEDKYIMNVKIDSAQRKIKVTADTTLSELHYYLQQIFNFDNQKAYAFFIKDKKTKENLSFYPRQCHTGNRTTERTTLEQLNLRGGRGFIYLYDFSVKWIFDIIVERKINEKVGKRFEVLERTGFVDQYPE